MKSPSAAAPREEEEKSLIVAELGEKQNSHKNAMQHNRRENQPNPSGP